MAEQNEQTDTSAQPKRWDDAAELHMALECINDGFIVLDEQWKFVEISGAAERMLGRSRQELAGRELWAEFPGLRDSPFGRAYIQAMQTRVTVEVADFYGPFEAWFVVRAFPRPNGLALVFRDVTREKAAEMLAERHRRHTVLTSDILRALTQTESLDVTLGRCVEAVVAHLGAAFARIWTLPPAEPVLELRASAGLYTHLDGPHARVPVGKFKIGLIAEERRPHLTNDVLHDPRVSDQAWARREGMVAFAGYPLIVERRLVGVIALFSKQRLMDDTLDALGAIADSIALGIERKRTDDARERVERERAALVERLRASEHELRSLVENLPELAWSALPDGHIDYYNQRWYEYTGTTFEEMQGWGWRSVHDPEILDAVIERWGHSLRTGEPFEMEFPLRRADGVFRWFLTRVRPVRDERGCVVRWFGTNTDVDDARRARAELQRADARLREDAETLETLNRVGQRLSAELVPDKLVQDVTDAATQLTGAQFGAFFYNVLDEQGGSYMLYALSGVPREKFSQFPMPRNTAIFAPTFTGQGIVRHDDVRAVPAFGKNAPYHGLPEGHLPVVSYLAVPVVSRSGKVIGGLFFGHERAAVFNDRAERLVAGLASQAAVAMDNARLFHEAQELIKALEKSNKELDQFAYVASHDLKAPLRGIASLSEWIEEDLADKLSESGRTHLNLLRGRVRRLEGLINGILDYSRAGRKVEAAETVAVRRLLEEVVELLGAPAQVAIDIGAGMPTLHTERVPLSQVFLNLLSNAVKHARAENPRVQIEARESGSLWEFSITDNGPGIEAQYQPRIWELFQVLEARDKVEGTGIGLAVVRKIVEGRGGQAWVESVPGQGATFRFTWPR